MSAAGTTHAVNRRRVAAPQRSLSARMLAGEQIAVAGGQLAAGAGNLLFALVLARLLAPGSFADMATFLALYLVIHVPAASFSAGSALAPDLAWRARWRVLGAGLAVGALLAATAPLTAAVLHMPLELMLVLAASAPTAGLIALDRGRLYGLGRRRRAVASLLAEPLVRLGAGVALAAVAGPVGGAVAVVAAGWAALAVAHQPRREIWDSAGRSSAGRRTHTDTTTAATAATTVAFLLLAVVQNQDLLLANSLLPDEEAGRFAVLSTLGGVAAFATTTIPLMLLPRTRRGERGALTVALLVAAGLGAAAVLAVLAAPGTIVGAVFGGRYHAVAPLAAPYVTAMALLGVARVLVAQACAQGRAAAAVAAVGLAGAVQAVLIVAIGDDAAGVATGTLIGTALLTAASGATVIRLPARASAQERRRAGRARDLRGLLLVAGITLIGIALRVLATRGIWLDEAITVHQAQMPLGAMLDNLRTTDVHPPLHHVVVWAFVHLFGTAELVVRAPSLIAGGALVPLLYAAGRDLYDRNTGLAAAAFGAVAPFAIWYSQEARMYAFFMLFALIAVWMQLRAVRDGRRVDWALYALASAALIWNQYFALLVVAVQQLAFAAFALARRRDGRPLRPLVTGWLASTIAIAVLVAPLVPFALDQFQVNEAAGKGFQQVPSQAGGGVGEQPAGPSIYGAITNFVWAMWGYHSDGTMTAIAALWPLAMLLALAVLGRGRSSTTRLVVACAVVPALALFALGQLKPFVFEVRYFIGAVPLLMLVLGRAVTSWPVTRRGIALAAAAVFATLAVGSADQQLNGTNPRVYDFEGALAEVDRRAGRGDVVVYSPPYLENVVNYYGSDLDARPIGDGVPSPRRGHRVFVVGSFLDKRQYAAQTGAAVAELRDKGRLVDTFERPQIRVWEFQ